MIKKEMKVEGYVEREDFIYFLSKSTPEEIHKFILEKGKPRKLVEPMIFFKKEDKEK